MKIKVRPEGRENIYLPEKKSLLKFVKICCRKSIHNYLPCENLMLGADHNKNIVLNNIKEADRLAIFTDPYMNIGHSLALIKNEKLSCYDIGKITKNDLILI